MFYLVVHDHSFLSGLLKHWPLEHLPESDLFTVTDVARSILRCKSIILSYKDGTNHIFTKEALFFEPYCLLSPPTVCKLMEPVLLKFQYGHT